MCNGVARPKATGLTYGNVKWVNACAIRSKTRLTLAGLYPLQALTRSLHFPHPAKGASPPGDAVVDGSYRDERTRDRPQSLPCSLVSEASLPQVCRSYAPWPPPASTRSLLRPTEQGHSTPSPVPRCSSFPASPCGCSLGGLDPKHESPRGCLLHWNGALCSKATGLTYGHVECKRMGL
jgi:hypothetical protein